MSLHKHALIRYRIIDSMLRNKYRPYPNIEEIRAKCEDSLFGSDWGEHISKSTIEKDFKSMRDDAELGFFAPIKYFKKEDGYYYTDDTFTIHSIPLKPDDIDAIKFASNTLMNFRESPLFTQFRFAIEKIFDRLNISSEVQDERLDNLVQFDSYPDFPGNDYLQPIYTAIKDYQKVEIHYKRFNSTESSVRVYHPYLLKEYKYRWYVIGYSEDKNRIVTYALDRMSKIESLEEDFVIQSDFNADTFFKYSFGITQIDNAPQKIQLKFPSSQRGYLQTQALHETQEIIEETSSYFLLQLDVLVTYELLERIMSYGENIEVVAPVSLKETIIKRYKAALDKYI
jgi:predicted DNA-binding transcriptional regulator YafY